MIVRHRPGDPKFTMDPDTWVESIEVFDEDTFIDAGWVPANRVGLPQPGEAVLRPEDNVIFVRSSQAFPDEQEAYADSVYKDLGWEVLVPEASADAS